MGSLYQPTVSIEQETVLMSHELTLEQRITLSYVRMTEGYAVNLNRESVSSETQKKVERKLVSSVDELVIQQLHEKHSVLCDKKFYGNVGLTAKEKRQLEMIEWELNALLYREFEERLDTLEILAERYEDMAKEFKLFSIMMQRSQTDHRNR